MPISVSLLPVKRHNSVVVEGTENGELEINDIMFRIQALGSNSGNEMQQVLDDTLNTCNTEPLCQLFLQAGGLEHIINLMYTHLENQTIAHTVANIILKLWERCYQAREMTVTQPVFAHLINIIEQHGTASLATVVCSVFTQALTDPVTAASACYILDNLPTRSVLKNLGTLPKSVVDTLNLLELVSLQTSPTSAEVRVKAANRRLSELLSQSQPGSRASTPLSLQPPSSRGSTQSTRQTKYRVQRLPPLPVTRQDSYAFEEGESVVADKEQIRSALTTLLSSDHKGMHIVFEAISELQQLTSASVNNVRVFAWLGGLSLTYNMLHNYQLVREIVLALLTILYNSCCYETCIELLGCKSAIPYIVNTLNNYREDKVVVKVVVELIAALCQNDLAYAEEGDPVIATWLVDRHVRRSLQQAAAFHVNNPTLLARIQAALEATNVGGVHDPPTEDYNDSDDTTSQTSVDVDLALPDSMLTLVNLLKASASNHSVALNSAILIYRLSCESVSSWKPLLDNVDLCGDIVSGLRNYTKSFDITSFAVRAIGNFSADVTLRAELGRAGAIAWLLKVLQTWPEQQDLTLWTLSSIIEGCEKNQYDFCNHNGIDYLCSNIVADLVIDSEHPNPDTHIIEAGNPQLRRLYLLAMVAQDNNDVKRLLLKPLALTTLTRALTAYHQHTPSVAHTLTLLASLSELRSSASQLAHDDFIKLVIDAEKTHNTPEEAVIRDRATAILSNLMRASVLTPDQQQEVLDALPHLESLVPRHNSQSSFNKSMTSSSPRERTRTASPPSHGGRKKEKNPLGDDENEDGQEIVAVRKQLPVGTKSNNNASGTNASQTGHTRPSLRQAASEEDQRTVQQDQRARLEAEKREKEESEAVARAQQAQLEALADQKQRAEEASHQLDIMQKLQEQQQQALERQQQLYAARAAAGSAELRNRSISQAQSLSTTFSPEFASTDITHDVGVGFSGTQPLVGSTTNGGTTNTTNNATKGCGWRNSERNLTCNPAAIQLKASTTVASPPPRPETPSQQSVSSSGHQYGGGAMVVAIDEDDQILRPPGSASYADTTSWKGQSLSLGGTLKSKGSDTITTLIGSQQYTAAGNYNNQLIPPAPNVVRDNTRSTNSKVTKDIRTTTHTQPTPSGHGEGEATAASRRVQYIKMRKMQLEILKNSSAIKIQRTWRAYKARRILRAHEIHQLQHTNRMYIERVERQEYALLLNQLYQRSLKMQGLRPRSKLIEDFKQEVAAEVNAARQLQLQRFQLSESLAKPINSHSHSISPKHTTTTTTTTLPTPITTTTTMAVTASLSPEYDRKEKTSPPAPIRKKAHTAPSTNTRLNNNNNNDPFVPPLLPLETPLSLSSPGSKEPHLASSATSNNNKSISEITETSPPGTTTLPGYTWDDIVATAPLDPLYTAALSTDSWVGDRTDAIKTIAKGLLEERLQRKSQSLELVEARNEWELAGTSELDVTATSSRLFDPSQVVSKEEATKHLQNVLNNHFHSLHQMEEMDNTLQRVQMSRWEMSQQENIVKDSLMWERQQQRFIERAHQQSERLTLLQKLGDVQNNTMVLQSKATLLDHEETLQQQALLHWDTAAMQETLELNARERQLRQLAAHHDGRKKVMATMNELEKCDTLPWVTQRKIQNSQHFMSTPAADRTPLPAVHAGNSFAVAQKGIYDRNPQYDALVSYSV